MHLTFLLTPNSEMEMRHLPFQTKVNNNERAFIKFFENLIEEATWEREILLNK